MSPPLPKGRPVTSSQPPCRRPYKPSSCSGSFPPQGMWPSGSGSLNTMSLRCPPHCPKHEMPTSTTVKVSDRVLGLQFTDPATTAKRGAHLSQGGSRTTRDVAATVNNGLKRSQLRTPSPCRLQTWHSRGGSGDPPAESVQGTGPDELGDLVLRLYPMLPHTLFP